MEVEPTIAEANEGDDNMWGRFKSMIPYGAAIFGLGLGAAGIHDFARDDYGDDNKDRHPLKNL